MKLDRRQFLAGGVAGAAVLLAGCAGQPSGAVRRAPRRPALREAGSRPRPEAAAGVEAFPQIKHIVVVMMENHSFDNILGTTGRGDGFTIGSDGRPTAKNPDGHGGYVHAFHMPTECQTDGVGNDWKVTHEAYDGGTCQGFVTAMSAETMGYFTREDLPFTCGMARTFPIADRYFCSVMAQTDPNRRYLIAGTSLGLIDDTFPSPLPPNGVIFDQLNQHGITWRDYYTTVPTVGVFLPLLQDPTITRGLAPIAQFYKDAASGSLPSFCLVEPDYDASIGGEPPGRAVRRPVHGPGGERGDVGTELAVHHADLELRRARWLLRPRPSPGGRPPRRRASGVEAG